MPEELPGNGDHGNLDEPPSFFPQAYLPADRDSSQMGELIRVRVDGVYVVESGGQVSRFVLLVEGERRLPILIGEPEAQSISMGLDDSPPDRPLTHDLVKTVCERLGAKVSKVVIDDLWNGIYYAKVLLQRGSEEMEIDSRPSDAIALAVRFDAPIIVAESILDSAAEE